MPCVQHFVSPKLPTTLTDSTSVDLPGYDLWLHFVNHVHVIPTELDITKFEDALSRVLQLYPHAAGQLRHIDGCWSIELANMVVPVDIDYKLDTSSDSLLDGDWVIQDDISSLLSQQPVHVNLVNGGAPLLRLKLTLFDHETCIGVSWNHSLGDGITMLRFMRTLSQFYQDLFPEFAVPTFKKHHFPTPSTVVGHSLPLHPNRDFDEAAFAKSRKDVEHVRWRMDNRNLEELRSVLSSDGQNKKYLSKQDCLTAYIVAVLNYNRHSPVQRVTNMTSYRHISASFIAENVAGNLMLIVPADIPDDMAGIASAIRDALIQSREPHYLEILESLKCERMFEAANAGKLFPFSFDNNELLVNSNTMIDWCSAHFGYPNGSRFHKHGSKDVLRCFRSNPAKGDDGIWRARQSIEIGVGVPGKLKPKIMETLARGVQYMLANPHAQP